EAESPRPAPLEPPPARPSSPAPPDKRYRQIRRQRRQYETNHHDPSNGMYLALGRKRGSENVRRRSPAWGGLGYLFGGLVVGGVTGWVWWGLIQEGERSQWDGRTVPKPSEPPPRATPADTP